jgi:hypothetical protein
LNNGPPPGYTFRVSVRGMSGSAIGGQPYYEVHGKDRLNNSQAHVDLWLLR